MSERKSKRLSETENAEADSEETTFIVEPVQVEVGAGYTVAVSHDEDDREVVDVKTYGQVDINQLAREIKRAFPDAEIRRFNKASSVAVVKSNEKRKKRKKK